MQPSNQIRVAGIISPFFDYQQATLIEGLTELGVMVRTSEASNYGVKLSDDEFVRFALSADLVFITSGAEVRVSLAMHINRNDWIFLDGCDKTRLLVDPSRFRLVFKREALRLDRFHRGPNVYPLPFAAEKRYFVEHAASNSYFLSYACSLENNPLRYSVDARLRSLDWPDLWIGKTNESAAIGTKKGFPGHRPSYVDILRRSAIAVNVPGASHDCARFYEIPSAGCLMLTYTIEVDMRFPFTDGYNVVEFHSLSDLLEKLVWLKNDPRSLAEIAERGFNHMREHHTTSARAKQFLEVCGYCI